MTAITTSPDYLDTPKVIEEEDTERDTLDTFRYYKRLLHSSIFIQVETQVNFIDQYEIDFDLSERDMNNFAYKMSQSSLNEFWEDEDDEYWNSYLD